MNRNFAREFGRRLRTMSEALRPFAIKGRKTAAYHAVFDTPEGEIVLRDLLREAGLLSTAAGDPDPVLAHRREGRREMGIHIVEALAWTESEIVAFAQAQTSEALDANADAA